MTRVRILNDALSPRIFCVFVVVDTPGVFKTMKHVKVLIKSSGLIGHVMHCDSIERDRSYIVRTKGAGGGYHSIGLVKGSAIEVI